MSRDATGRQTEALARFAAGLRFEDIPPDVLEAARNTIADGVACCVFGYRFAWSQAVLRHAVRMSGPGGRGSVLGPGAPRLHPPMAALVNGSLAHSFELDAGTRRGVGAHPFGTVFTAALPMAQDRGRNGRDLLTAFIAGSEVMLRIGRATGRSNEHRGFHAPGTTGPFGAAVAGALLYGLGEKGVLDALGIAGSMPSGLKQFSYSATGSSVKRLHFGRGAEGGVLATGLAAEGFDGPDDVLEGKAGFLAVYCDDYDVTELTEGLGTGLWRMREIAMKRFAAHGAAQVPLAALTELRARTPFAPEEIVSLHVLASPEAVHHHDDLAPADLMQAQYSVPFCLALGAVRDPSDPRAFDETALEDPAIRAVLGKIRYEAGDIADKRTCHMTLTLTGGRELTLTRPDPDIPWRPASLEEVRAKYARLMADCPQDEADALFARIQRLEDEPDLDWFGISR